MKIFRVSSFLSLLRSFRCPIFKFLSLSITLKSSETQTCFENGKLDISIWSDVSLLCHVDFLSYDGSIDQQLPSLCGPIYETVNTNYHFGDGFKRIHIDYCLIPEGIIRLIMDKYSDRHGLHSF